MLTLTLVLALGLQCGSATAAEIRLEQLEQPGEKTRWRTTNDFEFDWRARLVGASGPAGSYTAEYVIRDFSGQAITPVIGFSGTSGVLRGLQIPATSGVVPRAEFQLEIWAAGSPGQPHAWGSFGFDDAAPPPARPIVPTEWLKAGSTAAIGIEHPAPPLPAAGIRGYAYVLEHGGNGEPCAGPVSCTEAETDLTGGIADDHFQTGPLQEGPNVVRLVAVSDSGMRSPLETAALRVDGTPPRIEFSGLPQGWASGPVRVTAHASDPLSGMAASGPGGPLTTLGVDGGTATSGYGERASVAVHGEGTHLLVAGGRDAVGNRIEATDLAAPRALVRIDETPPVLAFLEHDPADPERIVARVDDGLSGAAPRGTIAVRPNGSSEPFQPLPTSTGGGRLIAYWDSDSFAPGNYEFRATGYDLAGNEAISAQRADGARYVLPNPIKTTSALELGFGGRRLVVHDCARELRGVRCHRRLIADFERRPRAQTVPFGRTVPVAGRLLSGTGAPLAGREVVVSETFAAGASPRRRESTVLTGGDGTFLARLGPGPSRAVSVAFAGSRQLTRAGSRELDLGVRTRVRLDASRELVKIGGAPVAFRGRVDRSDARVPSSGLTVQLQFQVLGTPWSEFRTVQTDGFGRFHYPYSFSDDDSRGIRFLFRAYVPEQEGWPYESGVSRPVAVTGR
jgi:hypothetical protein